MKTCSIIAVTGNNTPFSVEHTVSCQIFYCISPLGCRALIAIGTLAHLRVGSLEAHMPMCHRTGPPAGSQPPKPGNEYLMAKAHPRGVWVGASNAAAVLSCAAANDFGWPDSPEGQCRQPSALAAVAAALSCFFFIESERFQNSIIRV